MPLLTLVLPFIRAELHPTPLKLRLEIPVWAQNPRRPTRLIVVTVTLQGIFVLTAQSMNVPIAVNAPQVIPNIVAPKTTVLFATTSAIPPASAQIDFAPSATTWDMLLQIVPSRRTPVVVSSSMMETQKDCDLVPVVQVFEGGIVMVRGLDIIISIVSLPPLLFDSPFTFNVSTVFSRNTFYYTIE